MSLGNSATPLAKVRGLGSAGHGGSHWVEERFHSVAITLLSLWLIFSLVMLPALDRVTVVEWLREPAGGSRRSTRARLPNGSRAQAVRCR